MDNSVKLKIEKFNREYKRRSIRLRILSILMSITVFLTVYAMVLPAVTADEDYVSQNALADKTLTAYEKLRLEVNEAVKQNSAENLTKLYESTAIAFYSSGEISKDEYEALTLLISDGLKKINFSTLENPQMSGNTATAPADFTKLLGSANSWQVISGSEIATEYSEKAEYTVIYSKYDSSGKPVTGAEPVMRMKKSVLPAGEEDLFYICLSMEPIFYHDWEKIFASSEIILNNNSAKSGWMPGLKEKWNYQTPIYTVLDRIVKEAGIKQATNGNSSYLLDRKDVPSDWYFTPEQATPNNRDQRYARHVAKIVMYTSETDPSKKIEIDVDKFFGMTTTSGISILIATTEKCMKTPNLVNYNSETETLEFPYPVYNSMADAGMGDFEYMKEYSFAGNADVIGVSDIMGDRIVFEGTEYCNTGADSVSFSDNKLLWDVLGTLPYITDEKSDWVQVNRYGSDSYDDDFFAPVNAYQLIYKIRLDTSGDGFTGTSGDPLVTGSRVLTNGKTTLGIRLEDGTKQQADFVSPVVRGALYKLRFVKTDENGKALSGAVFTLKNGEKVIGTVTTGGDGTVEFSGLSFGVYQLIEVSSPSGYRKDGTGVWSVTLSYTSAPDKLVSENGYFRFTGNDDPQAQIWQIINIKAPDYSLQIIKTDPYGNLLSGAVFAVNQGGEEQLLPQTDSSGNAVISGKLLTDENYTLKELTAPTGYSLLSGTVKFRVNSDYTVTVLEMPDEFYSYSFDKSNGTLIFTVKNTPNVKLPSTGGTGAYPYYVIGILLMAVPTVILTVLTNKTKRKNRKEQ